ncbi:MAG: exodeoxyribonuclease VII large subunit, partial [Acidobacteria bacterium]|nr:exodeoxyribonuclease VII large subunit [Acidobacteriota bacterium]
HGVDVIILARGGGSLEDLAAFNDEALARVIAGSNVPVISAVGHETDFTICDFVADLRAPTPSAAAELVIESKNQIEERLAGIHRRLTQAARYRVLAARNRLTELSRHAAFAQFQNLLNRRQQRLDEMVFRLAARERERLQRSRRRYELILARLHDHAPDRRLQRLHRELDARGSTMASAMRTLLARRSSMLREHAARLESLSPLKVLERGYALAYDAAGNLIKSADQVRAGDEMRTRVARGEIRSKVSE